MWCEAEDPPKTPPKNVRNSPQIAGLAYAIFRNVGLLILSSKLGQTCWLFCLPKKVSSKTKSRHLVALL